MNTIISAPLRVGARLGLAPLSAEGRERRASVKGRPAAERGEKPGSGAERGEATAKPAATVAAPRSDPLRRTAVPAPCIRRTADAIGRA
jgi:hypothetical protein